MEKQNNNWPRLLDLEKAGQYSGTSASTIRDWIRAELLSAIKVPGTFVKDKKTKAVIATPTQHPLNKILVDREDLDELITKCKGEGQ